jgi:hypothetical protein
LLRGAVSRCESLDRDGLDVLRFKRVVCPTCGRELKRQIIKDAVAQGDEYVHCSKCGTQLQLPVGQRLRDVLNTEEDDQQEEVLKEHRVTAPRTRFEGVVYRLTAFLNRSERPRPTCFISYAWGDETHTQWVRHQLARDLRNGGVEVVLDLWDNPVGNSVPRFLERLTKCRWVIAVGTPLYKQKCDNPDDSGGTTVAAEYDLISSQRLTRTEALKATVLPLLLDGDASRSFPTLMQGRVFADFSDRTQYFDTLLRLLLLLHDISAKDPLAEQLQDALQSEALLVGVEN